MEDSNGIVSLPLPTHTPPDGLWPELVVQGWERPHSHAVSPDGSRVAFYLDRNGCTDLWIVDLGDAGPARGFAQQLTLNRPHSNWWEEEPPAWTPDGRALVYGAIDEAGVSNLRVVSAAGGAPRALTALTYDAGEPVVSPDGRFVAFSTQNGDVSQIGVVPLEGGWVIGVTSGELECSGPSWSPDGSRILYHASGQHAHRENDIYTIPFVEGYLLQLPARLTPDDRSECWNATFAPDGSVIALLCNASGHDELWLMAPDGSRLHQLTRVGQDIEDFSWSHDSRRLVCVASASGADHLLVVDAATGEARRLPAPPGNYTSPQWIRGREACAVIYDAPSVPPDLCACDLATGELTRLTRFSTPTLRNYSFAQPRFVEYTGFDGWRIPAMLYLPDGLPAGPAHSPAKARAGRLDDPRGAPAIVYPHGGPNADYAFMWDPVRQYFVAKGYAVICPNFRGSTGYGRQFREGNYDNWGVGDLQDCLSAADYLAGLPGVDRSRLAIWGQSYGAYLTTLALSKDPTYRFACGVALYGDSHLITSWARGDHSGRQDVEWQMGMPGPNRARYELGSPINFVRNIRAPLLLLHGERDARVHPDESRQLVAALKRHDKTFEFKLYRDEAHGFAHAANAIDALTRIERFLDWHLM